MKVTAWPFTDGFKLEVRVLVVFDLIVKFTVLEVPCCPRRPHLEGTSSAPSVATSTVSYMFGGSPIHAIVGRLNSAAAVGRLQRYLHIGDVEGAIQRARQAAGGDRGYRVVADGAVSHVARIETAIVPSPHVGGMAALPGGCQVERSGVCERECRSGIKRVAGARCRFPVRVTRIRVPGQAEPDMPVAASQSYRYPSL